MQHTYDKKYMTDAIPSKLTFIVTIGYVISGYAAGRIVIHSFDWNGDKDTMVLCKHEVTLPINIVGDIRLMAIKSLEGVITAIQAEAFKNIAEVKEAIKKLELLTYQPVETAAEILVPEENDFWSGPGNVISFGENQSPSEDEEDEDKWEIQ